MLGGISTEFATERVRAIAYRRPRGGDRAIYGVDVRIGGNWVTFSGPHTAAEAAEMLAAPADTLRRAFEFYATHPWYLIPGLDGYEGALFVTAVDAALAAGAPELRAEIEKLREMAAPYKSEFAAGALYALSAALSLIDAGKAAANVG